MNDGESRGEIGDQTTPRGEDTASPWETVRARFPAANRRTYLNIASRAIISRSVQAAAEDIVRAQSSGDVTKEDWQPMRDEMRRRFASLIKGAPDDVAITKNVSEGLNAVAASIDWKPGDNIVFCAELEHPNNIYLWLALRQRGVEPRMPPAKDGVVDTAAMIAAIDHHTRVVAASSVTFSPGFRTDVGALGRACRDAGALFLVDAVQSCGVLDIDVEEARIDALATSTSKGLLGLHGFGFLYVRQSWAERLHPAYIARFSVQRGKGHESEIEGLDYDLLPNARRFEIGNHNWVGLAAVNASLGELLALGSRRIESHVVGLAEALAKGLADLGLPVYHPPAGVRPSHIVTLGAFGGGDAYGTDDAGLNRLAQALTAGGVRFSIRRGQLRFGFHCYNDVTDVARVTDIARTVN